MMWLYQINQSIEKPLLSWVEVAAHDDARERKRVQNLARQKALEERQAKEAKAARMAQVAEENKKAEIAKAEAEAKKAAAKAEEEAKARRHRRQVVVERKLRESNEEFEADRAAQEAAGVEARLLCEASQRAKEAAVVAHQRLVERAAERRASRQARVENDKLAYKAREQEKRDYLAAARTADDSRICKTVQASNASGRSAAAGGGITELRASDGAGDSSTCSVTSGSESWAESSTAVKRTSGSCGGSGSAVNTGDSHSVPISSDGQTRDILICVSDPGGSNDEVGGAILCTGASHCLSSKSKPLQSAGAASSGASVDLRVRSGDSLNGKVNSVEISGGTSMRQGANGAVMVLHACHTAKTGHDAGSIAIVGGTPPPRPPAPPVPSHC